MRDRLMLVGSELARWPPCLPVEVDGGGEGEHAGDDAREEALRALGQVSFEEELVLQRLHDRLDPLADEADGRLGSLGLVGAAGADRNRSQRAHRLLEVAGEALVAEDKLAVKRLPLEQGESGL